MLKKIISVAGAVADHIDTRDVFLFGGLFLAAYGLSLIYFPVSFIAPGAVLTYLAIAADNK